MDASTYQGRDSVPRLARTGRQTWSLGAYTRRGMFCVSTGARRLRAADRSLLLSAARTTDTFSKLSIKILIVDDEEPLRRFVDRVLSGAGYSTAKASDGPDALEVGARLGTVDILVTDLVMPGITGDELARQM